MGHIRHLTPHTAEWFTALESCNAMQAAQTRQIIKLAGKSDVCSVCGDAPATDYKVDGAIFALDVGATVRLCDDCREIRKSSQGESFRKL